MKTTTVIVCVAVLALAPAAAAQRDTQRSMPLAGVSLELKARQQTLLKQLSARASLKKAEDDEWLVYSPQGQGTPSWLGTLVFKKGKLAFAAKSWGSPGHHMAKDFVAQVNASHKNCQFAVGQTLDPHSPVRLTSLYCGRRGLVLQITTDKSHGLYACEIETLGKSKDLLAKVDFWKPCHSPARPTAPAH
jgi:hypothetical protein